MSGETLAVLGFYFSLDRKEVLLIEKKRPAWQRGKLNGVGGRIEQNELPYHAMRREFREETGIDECGWERAFHLVDTLHGCWIVNVFYAFGIHSRNPIQMTDEKPIIVPVDNLPMNTICNLRWMIPIILDETVCKNIIFNIMDS